MAKILAAGLESWIVRQIALRLPGTSIVELAEPDLVDAERNQQPGDLLILDHSLAAPKTPDLLARLRRVLPELPIIYCLDADAGAMLVRRLLLDLKANEIMFHPMDAGALAERAAALLQLRYDPAGERESTDGRERALKRRLAGVWNRSRSRMLERLGVLDRASAALLHGSLEPGLRTQAESEAHKLAGSLGTFGLHAASRFASEMEHLLRNDSMRSEARARRYADVAGALRAEIERSPALGHAGGNRSESARAPLLLVEGDEELAAQLIDQAAARDWRWEPAPNLNAARSLMPEVNPSVVLVDSDGLERGSDTLAFLKELSRRRPPVPALIMTSGSDLMDRVEVARLGGRGFFPRNLPPGEIVDAALAGLDRMQSSRALVLAVDDDPAVLDVLAALLGSSGIRFAGISDPLRFWDALQGSPPDLLILDVQMPSISGIELCRVMRNDPRWASTPVIFLTAFADAIAVERAFAAGADDFVAKPIVGPELITRITNRLERTRLMKETAEIDSISGLANRTRFRRAFGDFIRLADRLGQPMGMAVLSVDGLRHINETHGPASGDEVVRRLGEHFRQEFRSEEIAARYAANDFTIGLYGLDRPGSLRRIEEVARAFEQQVFGEESSGHSMHAGLKAGATFSVTLSGGVAAYPEDGSDLDSLLRAAGEGRTRASEAGGGRLLAARASDERLDGPRLTDLAVVSGDEAIASVLLRALESAGYRVRALRNGLAAARVLSGVAPSLQARVIVIDLDLPNVDGLALCRQIAGHDAPNPSHLIVLSSAALGREAALALEAGAEDYIARPVDVPVLIERVRRALESSAPGSTVVQQATVAGPLCRRAAAR